MISETWPWITSSTTRPPTRRPSGALLNGTLDFGGDAKAGAPADVDVLLQFVAPLVEHDIITMDFGSASSTGVSTTEVLGVDADKVSARIAGTLATFTVLQSVKAGEFIRLTIPGDGGPRPPSTGIVEDDIDAYVSVEAAHGAVAATLLRVKRPVCALSTGSLEIEGATAPEPGTLRDILLDLKLTRAASSSSRVEVRLPNYANHTSTYAEMDDGNVTLDRILNRNNTDSYLRIYIRPFVPLSTVKVALYQVKLLPDLRTSISVTLS